MGAVSDELDPVSFELNERCVMPFYGDLMGKNATRLQFDLDLFSRVAAETTDDEVIGLLSADWRPRAVGAWLAIGRSSEAVDQALLDSVESSEGAYSALPLAVAAAFAVPDRAIASLLRYREKDRREQGGAAAFVEAAVAYLGGPIDSISVVPDARADFEQMLAVAVEVAGRVRPRQQ